MFQTSKGFVGFMIVVRAYIAVATTMIALVAEIALLQWVLIMIALTSYYTMWKVIRLVDRCGFQWTFVLILNRPAPEDEFIIPADIAEEIAEYKGHAEWRVKVYG